MAEVKGAQKADTTGNWSETGVRAQDAAKEGQTFTGTTSSKGGSSQKMTERVNKTVLLSAMTWDVFAPAPSNTFKGKVIPRVVNRFSKRRKMSVEVHRVTPLNQSTSVKGKKMPQRSYDECVVRVLRPSTKQKEVELKREALSKHRADKGSNEIFNSAQDIHIDDDDDESVADTIGLGSAGASLIDTGGKDFDGWKARYRIPCGAITIEQQVKKSVHMLIQVDSFKQEREIIFDTVEDATNFCEKLAQERQLEAIRSHERLQSALGHLKLAPFERMTLLFEVVSGWDLPIGDLTTSDPYVVCMIGRREVHRTKHISGTLNPIWTISTGSLCLLTVKSEELFIEEGMHLLVKDFDQFGKNETLGMVHIPPHSLYEAYGERMEFKLKPVPGKTAKKVPGYLAIRCRRATEHDKTFMKGFEESGAGVAAPKLPKTHNNAIKSIITRNEKTENGTTKYKVRPRPDKQRPEETEWLTRDEIEAEVKYPSQFWTDSGNGKLGRVFLEVLGCDDLPNLDTGGFLGNKTDAFVSVVYGDVFVRTDTIDDCLSPRWLPWSHRAFILNINHASTQIFLGVFDYDSGYDDHDLIGRVSIDITNLRRDTEYLLSYNLYPSARVADRASHGKVHLRLRIEIPDERKLALSVLEPPPSTYVNVKKGKDFHVIRHTCLGKHDVDKYSLTTVMSYVEELQEYQHLLMYVEDALMTLLLWRGHFPLEVGGKAVLIPLHSAFAFFIAVVLVERPQLYPSFCFACISWYLFAVMGWKRNGPDVWGRCHSYGEIFQKVVLGKCTTPAHDIKPFEGYEGAKVALETWMKRISDAEAKAEKDYNDALKEEEERLKEIAELGEADGDISTKVGGGLTIDPLRATIHPYQLMLGTICRSIRFVKHVASWEESFFSFWIATGTAFLAFVCLFVPWFFIIRWTARIVVWTLFGPWMKLVDIFYVSAIKPESEEEQKAREFREELDKQLEKSKTAKEQRLVRESAAKMREMKKYMFGKFSTRIPILKQDRYCDRPLPESSATPYEHKPLSLAELAMQEAGYNRIRLPGQTLVGDMIPVTDNPTFTMAPTGKPTANPELLAKDTLGSGDMKKPDSTASAYVQISSLVVLAGVFTFFGVPILASFTEFVVGMIERLDAVDNAHVSTSGESSGFVSLFRRVLTGLLPSNGQE